MTQGKVNIITLGCSKNLVDSEVLLGRLRKAGVIAVYEAPEADMEESDTVVVNTCGFIGDAKEESVNEILRWASARSRGAIGRLIVMGCLSERYRKDLEEEIPEVDVWFGKTDWNGIVDMLRPRGEEASDDSADNDAARTLTKGDYTAYIKIAEGCNRFCAFCAIPLITGRYRSRRPEDILAEVASLARRGVKEFNIIAQDLTSYGRDLEPGGDGQSPLASLVDAMADIEGVEWIRLHYAYPADFPLDVLDVMARRQNVCKYLDIALQHISDKVLSNMRRHIDARRTRELLAEIRRRVPGIHIRTTLMTGFPGEGPEEFDDLLDFVREQRFERMGAFAYCEEEGTYAAEKLEDSVPEDVKQERLARLMALQEEISAELQEQKIGRTLRVLIDRREWEWYAGRSQYDSPEVDPEILIPAEGSPRLEPGDMVDVVVEQAMPFELIGRVSSR